MPAIPVYDSAGREQPRPAFGRCRGCLPPRRPRESCRETKGRQRSAGTVGIQGTVGPDDGWIDTRAVWA